MTKISEAKTDVSKDMIKPPDIAVSNVEEVVEGMETIAEQDLDGLTEGRLSENSKKLG